MLPEYDFSGKKGQRGKYHQAYERGHTVRIVQEDGSVTTQYFTLEDGAVLLEPDVREYFPNSGSVNEALRGLIKLIPHERGVRHSRRLKIDHRQKGVGGANCGLDILKKYQISPGNFRFAVRLRLVEGF